MTEISRPSRRQVTLSSPARPILPLDALRARRAELLGAERRLEVNDARLKCCILDPRWGRWKE